MIIALILILVFVVPLIYIAGSRDIVKEGTNYIKVEDLNSDHLGFDRKLSYSEFMKPSQKDHYHWWWMIIFIWIPLINIIAIIICISSSVEKSRYNKQLGFEYHDYLHGYYDNSQK